VRCAAPPPRLQVLYSTFVSLLDTGKVRAARLEAGASRLYFDMVPHEEAEAAAGTMAGVHVGAAAAAAAAASSAKATKGAIPVPTATHAVASSAAVAAQRAAQPAAPASPHIHKQFFIKLADKTDHLLVHRIVNAGVEFAVVKATLTGALQNIVLSALALWLPLLPILFIIRRCVRVRCHHCGSANAPHLIQEI
jgi:hypothetical protein